MRVPSARSPGVGLAKVPQRAYLDLAGATAWDISPVGSRGNLDLMQYALISFDVQLILAQMPRPPPWRTLQQGGVCPPPRTGPAPRFPVILPRGQTLVEPGARRRKVRLEAPTRSREAVLLRRAHAAQWLAAPYEGPQLRRLGG